MTVRQKSNLDVSLYILFQGKFYMSAFKILILFDK